MKLNNYYKTIIIILYIAACLFLLYGCEKERDCQTWSCKTWDSEGNVKWVEVFGPNHQLYTHCDCIGYYERNWK
jgi:hypothetical protein